MSARELMLLITVVCIANALPNVQSSFEGTSAPRLGSDLGASPSIRLDGYGSIRINEVYPDPDTDVDGDGNIDQDDEFIELYNDGPAIISVQGWCISDGSDPYVISWADIPVCGFLLLGRSVTGIVLGSGETLTLKDGSGAIVDSLTYEAARKGYSCYRCPDGSDRVRERKVPTPGYENPLPPWLLINEVMVDPEGVNSMAQWMEIVNCGDREEIAGSRITNSEDVDLYLPPLTLDGGERAVICIGSADGLPPHPPEVKVLELGCTKALYTVGDDLQFLDPDGYLTDFWAWGASSHIDPPLDILGGTHWTGKIWDVENGTLSATGTDNPIPRTGRSLMRRPDMNDTDSPLDMGIGDLRSPSTPGWSNDFDPSFDITVDGPLTFEAGEHRTVLVDVRPHTIASDMIGASFALGDAAWSLEAPGSFLYTPGVNGSATIPLGITSPSDISNHTAKLLISSFWNRSRWYKSDVELMALIPACDLSLEDPVLLLDDDRVDSIPEGAIAQITGWLTNPGEVPTPPSLLLLHLTFDAGIHDIAMERAIDTIKPGGRRSFSFDLDTMGWSGNLTATITADPFGVVSEFDEGDNLFSMNATIVPTPIPPGVRGLVLDRVLFNESSSARYALVSNPSGSNISADGMRIGDRIGYFILPRGSTIPARGSIAIAWGADAIPRVPTNITTFRGDGEGPISKRMDRIGRVPDPLWSGALVLETAYRKTIDVLCTMPLRPCPPGWSEIGRGFVQATHGTEVHRRKDPTGSCLDTNTSLDWTCNGGSASILAFCPAPKSASGSELITISFEDCSDPSGYMLSCGGRSIVIPNGTSLPERGTITAAKDPASFLMSQGRSPDLLFGGSDLAPDGSLISGMQVPGGGSFILPGTGGWLDLYDPSLRLLDTLSWGGAGIGEVPEDVAIVRTRDRTDMASWSYLGRASSYLALDLMSGMEDMSNISFTICDLDHGLAWVCGGGDEPMRVRTDIPYAPLITAMSAHLVRGGPVEMSMDTSPWETIPAYIGPMSERDERISASLFILEEGATVRHSRSGSAGSGCIVMCGDRVLYIYMNGPVHDGIESDTCAIGYRMGDPFSTDKVADALFGMDHEWADSSETLRSHAPDIPPYAPDMDLVPVEAPRLLLEGPLEVRPGPTPPHGISLCSELTVMDTTGLIDLPCLLDSIGEGCSVRVMTRACPHPILDTDGVSVSGPTESAGEGTPDLLPWDEDPFLSAIRFQRSARDRGLDVEVRMLPFDGGASLPAAIVGDRCAFSCIGTAEGPGNAFWIGASFDDRPPDDWTSALWAASIPLPEGMLGDGNAGPETTSSGRMLIEEVYFDTYVAFDPDEYVSLYNPGPQPIDIRGWTLSDDEGSDFSGDGTLLFGSHLVVGPRESLFVARNGTAFASQNGFAPDLAWERSDSSHGTPLRTGSPVITNGNDSICLRDPLGRIADVVPMGRCIWDMTPWRYIAGGAWYGPAVPSPGWGHILFRSQPWSDRRADTDRLDDWSTWRPRYPGQSRFGPFPPVLDSSARIGLCPDTSSEVLSQVISGASRHLCINVYEICSSWITKALIGARERGVSVRLILEGGPVGGVTLEETEAVSSMVEAGIEVRWMENDPDNDARDRYRYDHAKYVIADGRWVLVSSDNFKDTSFPPMGLVPVSGTRGWVAAVDSAELAGSMLIVFMEDWNGFDMAIATSGRTERPPGTDPSSTELTNETEGVFKNRPTDHACDRIDLLISPDHLSIPDNPLIEAIEGAEREVMCELLDLSTTFDLSTMDHAIYPPAPQTSYVPSGCGSGNPYLDALLSAANNGASVRVILDGTDFDLDGDPDNAAVAERVRYEAASRGLAGLFKVELMPSPSSMGGAGIGLVHNKGVIIDGRTCWISSLNWGPTSALENREVGLLITSEGIAEELERCFEVDWGATLQDEVDIRKDGWTIRCLNETWISATLSVTLSSMLNVSLALSPGSLLDAVEGGSLEWSGHRSGNSTVVNYTGPVPPNGRLILLATDGNRTAYLTSFKAERPEKGEAGPWGYPFYEDPIFPLFLMVTVPIAASIPLALIRSRRRVGISHNEE